MNVPHAQLDLFSGPTRRDIGMAASLASAERKTPTWTQQAIKHAIDFIYLKPQFMCEDLRAFAEQNGLSPATNHRAWGSVIISLVRAGLIRRVGYAPVNNPAAHCTPAAVWERI